MAGSDKRSYLEAGYGSSRTIAALYDKMGGELRIENDTLV
jgi:hypothetical protein